MGLDLDGVHHAATAETMRPNQLDAEMTP